MSQRSAPLPSAAPISSVPLRLPQPIVRIGGGYETDVFHCGDRDVALKLKQTTGDRAAVLARVRLLREVSERFQAYLGAEHSLPSDYLIIASPRGKSQILAVQPFLDGAQTLDNLDITALSPERRSALAAQLTAIVAGARACYQATGSLPDLYGLEPEVAAQARRWDPRWLFRAGWHLLTGRPLINAHNLLLAPDGRVVLVDYDPICSHWLFCRFAYAGRALLLWRDQLDIAALSTKT